MIHYCNYCKKFTETKDKTDCVVCGMSKTNTNLDMEYIKHASCLGEGGWTFIGKCHGDCFHKGHHLGIRIKTGADSQGFVTNKGRFVTRSEGAEIAHKAGQIDKETTLLFSEDLWCPTYQGKYKYCEVKGYIERDDRTDLEEENEQQQKEKS